MTSILEEKDSIRELIANYCFYYDDAMFEQWVDLWTDDAVFNVDGKTLRGRAALQQFTCEARLVNGKPPVKHLTMNQVIEVNGHTAIARCYLLTMMKRKDGALTAVTAGVYNDKLVKTDRGWRFAERTLRGDLRWANPPAESSGKA